MLTIGGISQLQLTQIKMDGVNVGSRITPTSDSFTLYTSVAFTVLAGNSTLTLSATDATGDKTSFLDDINKIVCAGFDWDNRAADATLREYIAYKFSPDVVDEVMRAIPILEANLTRAKSGEGASTRFVMPSVAGASEADALLEKAQDKLSPRAKTAWRWRVLRLRAALDVELSQNEFAITSRAEVMLRELTQIYHAQNAASPVAPPTQEALRANRPV